MKEFLSRGGGSEKTERTVGVNKGEDYKERKTRKVYVKEFGILPLVYFSRLLEENLSENAQILCRAQGNTDM